MVNISKAQSTNIIEIVRNNRKRVFPPNLQSSSRSQGGEKTKQKPTTTQLMSISHFQAFSMTAWIHDKDPLTIHQSTT